MLVTWLVATPGWQLVAAVVLAVIGLYGWLRFLDSLIPEIDDLNENYTQESFIYKIH